MGLQTSARPDELPTPLEAGDAVPKRSTRWWHEALTVVGFYAVYTLVRDLHATHGGFVQATRNALELVHAEKAVDAFHEQWFQHLFLKWRGFMEFWNSFYGTAHFILVIVVLVVLYFRYPTRYRLWRNTLALTTALALIGFAFFPVVPPRLLPASFHFVDTLKTIGGVWNFSNGPVAALSNQYAAMPSLHCAWSLWCALAVLPLIRPWWGKLLAATYPLATVFCVVITANHLLIDVAGGWLTVAVAFVLATMHARVMTGRRRRIEAAAEKAYLVAVAGPVAARSRSARGTTGQSIP